MRIHCTKDEFALMAVNCSQAICEHCVLRGVCNGGNFTEFVVDVNCYNPHPQPER